MFFIIYMQINAKQTKSSFIFKFSASKLLANKCRWRVPRVTSIYSSGKVTIKVS